MSLLLKQSPLVTELSLYDIVHTPGVAADLSHIDTPAKVTGNNGAENLEKALQGRFDCGSIFFDNFPDDSNCIETLLLALLITQVPKW